MIDNLKRKKKKEKKKNLPLKKKKFCNSLNDTKILIINKKRKKNCTYLIDLSS